MEHIILQADVDRLNSTLGEVSGMLVGAQQELRAFRARRVELGVDVTLVPAASAQSVALVAAFYATAGIDP